MAAAHSGEQAFTLEVFQQHPPPAGLVSWWRAENNGLDSAGANHGLVTNGASYAAGKVNRSRLVEERTEEASGGEAGNPPSSEPWPERPGSEAAESGEQV